jgi:Undecaprenyl-phosphate galactose phosphotransferase WbaP
MFLPNPQIIDELSRLPAVAPSRSGSGRSVDRWPSVCGILIALADCIAAIIVVKISLVLVAHFWGWSRESAVPNDGLEVACIAIGAYLAFNGRYSDRIPFWHDARLVAGSSLCVFAGEVGLGIVHGDLYSRVPVLAALLLFPVAATVANHLAKSMLTHAGIRTVRVVVIGSYDKASEVENTLNSDPSLGYSIVGRLDSEPFMSGPPTPRLRPLLEQYRARCLLIAGDGTDAVYRQLTECALRERVEFATMVQPCTAPTFASRPTYFFSHDAMLLSFRDGLSQPIPRIAKSAMDVLGACILLVLTAPVFLIVSIANMLDGGPILFRQRRVGAGGRPFYCLKFRTMVVDADRALQVAFAKNPALAIEWKERRKLADDPRVTRIGRFLRGTSLDEVPQLINVLRREMSLVGPRPIVEDEVYLYGHNIAQYYATRPGLTGLWQVSGRSKTSYARRVQLDVWYVNNWTFWNDIAVLLKTIPVVFGREGAY